MECRFCLICLNKQDLSGLMARLCKPCHKRQGWRRMAEIERENGIWEIERIRRDFCKIPPYSKFGGRGAVFVRAIGWVGVYARAIARAYTEYVVLGVLAVSARPTRATPSVSLLTACSHGVCADYANIVSSSAGCSIEPMLRATRSIQPI